MRAQNITSETILSLGMSERSYPEFWIGDTIEVHLLVQEGSKERVQIFKGDVIAMHKKGGATTFTVRKIGANNVSVERIFPFYSPIIKDIKVTRKGKTRRAKAYYIRDRVGKSARFKEAILTKKQKEEAAASKKKAKVAAKASKAGTVASKAPEKK